MKYLQVMITTPSGKTTESYTPYGPLDGQERVPYDGHHYGVFEAVTDIFIDRYGPQFLALLNALEVGDERKEVLVQYDEVGQVSAVTLFGGQILTPDSGDKPAFLPPQAPEFHRVRGLFRKKSRHNQK
jgi:hypothetical protein